MIFDKLPKGLMLVILSFVLYINTLGHDFVLDDAIVISENMYTQQGVFGWKGLLTKDTFHGFFKEDGKDQLVAGGRYRPLSPMLFALVYQIAGNSPFAFHLINILLYAAFCWLLYVFFCTFCRLLRIKSEKDIAFVASLLFAAHATHTEVVANIKGADEILSAMGGIATLILLMRYQEKNQIKDLLLAALTFFLSLLAKENTVTLLAIAPLTLFMTHQKKWTSIVRPTITLLGVFIIYFFIRSSVVGWPWDGITPNELMNNPFMRYEGQVLVPMTLSETLGTNFYTLLIYLKLLVFPHPLIHDYYPRQIPIHLITSGLSLVSIVIHLFLAGWALWMIRRKNLIAYGILFYLLAMSVTSNFVFPVGTNMSERFLFFPSIGFSLIASYVLIKLIHKNQIIGWSCIALIIILLCTKTIMRNPAWKNNYVLFQTDVKNAPNSAKLQNAAAGSIVTKFESLKEGPEKTRMMGKAVDHAAEALCIHPLYKNAHLLKGNAHLYQKEYEEAITSYENALRIDPAYPEALNNMQIALRTAGRHYGEKVGDFDKSLALLKRAYEMKADDAEAIRLIGVAYGMKGTHSKAVEYFNKLVELKPNNVEYLKMLGTALHHNGQIDDSNRVLTKAKTLDPEKFKQ